MNSLQKIGIAILFGVASFSGLGIAQANEGHSHQILMEPPRLLYDYYPAEGLFKDFKGRVIVEARIGKDGTVTATKIMVTSGHPMIDQYAMAVTRKWKFKPALDDKGQPMEIYRIISIPFNVPNSPRQIEEHNRIGKN